jgi:hypothetical protein
MSSYKLLGDIYASYINGNLNLKEDYSNGDNETVVIDDDRARESVTRVNIFYESLSYTVSTETPQMDFVSLLANIGGNLGLFLGVSLFSICELVEVAFEFGYIWIVRKKTHVSNII